MTASDSGQALRAAAIEFVALFPRGDITNHTTSLATGPTDWTSMASIQCDHLPFRRPKRPRVPYRLLLPAA
jgi:hypothetical protein